MAGRVVNYGDFEFEVWENSMCMRKPFSSPILASYTKLDNQSALESLICNFIDIMNLGIKVKENRSQYISKVRPRYD